MTRTIAQKGSTGSAQRRSLLDSSKAYLAEAIRSHEAHKDAFAIVHAVTAVELALKERLARINPVLVRRDIDKHPPDRMTVSLSAIPRRLANLGVPLGDRGATLVLRFANWRNDVVHHLPTYDESDARAQLPRLLDFLAKFLQEELGVPLKSVLPRDLFASANILLKSWATVVADAAKRARAEGNVLAEPCPVCGATGVLSSRGEGPAHCHLCDSNQYRLDHCVQCGRQTMVVFSTLGDNYCDECIEAAGDEYMQMKEDIARGK